MGRSYWSDRSTSWHYLNDRLRLHRKTTGETTKALCLRLDVPYPWLRKFISEKRNGVAAQHEEHIRLLDDALPVIETWGSASFANDKRSRFKLFVENNTLKHRNDQLESQNQALLNSKDYHRVKQLEDEIRRQQALLDNHDSRRVKQLEDEIRRLESTIVKLQDRIDQLQEL